MPTRTAFGKKVQIMRKFAEASEELFSIDRDDCEYFGFTLDEEGRCLHKDSIVIPKTGRSFRKFCSYRSCPLIFKKVKRS